MSAFNTRNLACIPDNVHWSYDDMVKGVLPQMAARSDEGFQKPFKLFVLAQERHAGAKKLMSWLVSSEHYAIDLCIKVLTI